LNCVVDSCIWISAFQFGGTPFNALHLAFEEHRLSTCEQIRGEVRDVLTERFNWSDDRFDAVLAEFSSGLIQVETPGHLSGICRDASDDVIIECAVLAGADLIITGDKDLLAVRQYRGIRIVTPRQFLDEFAGRNEAEPYSSGFQT